MTNLSQFIDREVWVVTAADGPRRGGLVATWVQASSLDPADPIVTISISANHFTRELIDASGVFALHLLAEDQTDVAFNFCTGSGRDRDKLAVVDWTAGDLGSPELADCLGAAECRVVDRFEAAGRILYFADITAARVVRDARPLREHALMKAADAQQLAALGADREADIRTMRQAIAAWRAKSAAGRWRNQF
jgi:flavin reductase (DIM6/NTAB) family NADH-FMN oxidoreductase RutF